MRQECRIQEGDLLGADSFGTIQLTPDDIANKIIKMMNVGPTKTGAGGASGVSLRETAETIFKNLDKVERKILLVGKDGKIWEKTLPPLDAVEINRIMSKVREIIPSM